MAETYTGILKVKNDTIKVSDKFRKREFVVTDNATSYPQTILFQLSQDRCDVLDKFNIGDEVKVTYNLNGREWKNPQGEIKYFNTLSAFIIVLVKKGEGTQNASIPTTKSEVPKQEETLIPTPDDDLPF